MSDSSKSELQCMTNLLQCDEAKVFCSVYALKFTFGISQIKILPSTDKIDVAEWSRRSSEFPACE